MPIKGQLIKTVNLQDILTITYHELDGKVHSHKRRAQDQVDVPVHVPFHSQHGRV